MRNTKIICTLGPSTDKPGILKELMLEGMDVARFNFSHGGHEEQGKRFDTVVKMRKELDLPIATLLDTKGPEIRIKNFKDGKVELKKDQTFILTSREVEGSGTEVSITYKELVNDVSVGTTILIDDGLIAMKVVKCTDKDIICKVENSGFVSNHKGVNVPGVHLSMPFISPKDKEDILFGIEKGVGFIAG